MHQPAAAVKLEQIHSASPLAFRWQSSRALSTRGQEGMRCVVLDAGGAAEFANEFTVTCVSFYRLVCHHQPQPVAECY
jgi:hypothetical protein